jgi:hypothetical protein
MTLELGSWLWIKKNPRQLFSRRHLQSDQGAPHRAGAAPPCEPVRFSGPRGRGAERWLPHGPQRLHLLEQARAHWQNRNGAP